LAACGSSAGASAEVCRRADDQGWTLIVTPYVLDEVATNLDVLPPGADAAWDTLRPRLTVMHDVFTIDRPAVFGPAKDRPILFGALAWADVLLTLDQGDFGPLLGRSFYSLRVMRPGAFLEEQRAAGRLT
jgi:hypothetical protein